MNNPGKIDFNKTYDKFSEAKKGMYASTLAVYDIITKEFSAKTFDYLEHFNALYDRDNTVQPMMSLSGNDRLNEKSNSLIHYKHALCEAAQKFFSSWPVRSKSMGRRINAETFQNQ